MRWERKGEGLTDVLRSNRCLALKQYCQDLLKTHSEELALRRHGHSYFCTWPYWICICRSFPFRRKMYGRTVLNWITQHLRSSNYWYLRHYLTPPKKHVLKQAVIWAALGRLWEWSGCVFMCALLVNHSEFSPLISTVLELCSHANLPCLVNLAQSVVSKRNSSPKNENLLQIYSPSGHP